MAEHDSLSQPMLFDSLASRQVVADFKGGHLSSDGGVLLLRQIDLGLGVSAELAQCFSDRRDQRFVEHGVSELVRQLLHGLALGYEDLNDHELLRLDPLLAVAAGKTNPLRQRWDQTQPALASPSTLNRLQLSNNKRTAYHKIDHDPEKIAACLLKMAVRCLPKGATELVLDLDGMGHLVHGLQEGRHFSTYYDGYCYQPLYVVCAEVVLWAQLRTGERGPKEDVLAALEQIITAIRARLPKVRLIIRADGGFCGEELMAWCEQHKDVYFVLGLRPNPVLIRSIERQLFWAAAKRCLCGPEGNREFSEFEYKTGYSWSKARRVVAKAEVTAEGNNPRFVVTNLPPQGWPQQRGASRFTAQGIYEQEYCPRGNMENILKQQVLDLGADRMSTHHLASNQLRLWLATFAYLLLERLRALTLRGTQLAKATAGTIRLKLLKVAAALTISVRRVHVEFCSAFPLQKLFRTCQRRLMALWPASG